MDYIMFQLIQLMLCSVNFLEMVQIIAMPAAAIAPRGYSTASSTSS
jgi:hypothetical protein